MPPFKRPDSKYYWIRYTDKDGRRRSESARTSVYKDAIALEQQKRAQAHYEKTDPTHRLQTFDSMMDSWLTETGNRERDIHATKALYQHLGGLNVNDITPQHINDYKRARKQQKRTDATIRKELTVLQTAIRYAAREWGWNIKNPVAGRLPPKCQGRIRWITHEEAERLIQGCDDKAPYLPDMIKLALNTGMRRGEILNLEWSRVDLGQRLIHLDPEHQKNRRYGSVPLNTAATDTLRARFHPGRYVFEQNGKPIGSIKRSFATACRRAELEDLTFHDLRHTFASWLIQAGVPLAQVSEAMRHSDIRMTMVYAHLAPDAARSAVEVLDTVAETVTNQQNTVAESGGLQRKQKS